jgi:hypothetical protein
MKVTYSWQAFIIVILPMLPNIIYFIMPPNDVPQASGNKIIESLESISRIIGFALLIFMAQNPNPSLKSPWVFGMLIFLLLYIGLWGRYFLGGGSYALLGKSFLGIPSPMAIFPVCYFICAAVWLGCVPAIVAWIVFLIFHLMALA